MICSCAFVEWDVIAFFDITVSYRSLGIHLFLLPKLCMCIPLMKKLLPVSFTEPDNWEGSLGSLTFCQSSYAGDSPTEVWGVDQQWKKEILHCFLLLFSLSWQLV